MPPRRSGLDLWRCVALALVIQTGEALNLNTPPPFSLLAKVFQVSWTTSPGDPKSFNLWALCDNSQPIQLSKSEVRTDKSPFSVPVDPLIFKMVTHPISCKLQAKSLDGDALLASTNPFKVNPDDQGIAPTSHIQASDSHATSVTPAPTTVAGQSTVAPATKPSASATVTGQPTTTPIAGRKNPTGPIVGGVLGGLAFMVLLFVGFILYRRRRRSATYPTLVPLVHEQGYTQPLDKNGRLAQVVSEKTAAERQRDQLQMDLAARNRAPRPGSISNASQAESEARLRRQVELMSERILELEAQQRELEAYGGSLFDEDRSQPPPDYSATAGSRSIA